ncbi:MAG: DUF309 domain-containing protein [Actinomycetota bacterium]
MKRSLYIDEGIRLFNVGDYFMAHETLEEYWVEAPSDQRDFLQGLIQLSVGMHHYTRANLKGTRLQFAKALKRLSGYPQTYDGVDIAAVRLFLEAAPANIEDAIPLSPPSL